MPRFLDIFEIVYVVIVLLLVLLILVKFIILLFKAATLELALTLPAIFRRLLGLFTYLVEILTPPTFARPAIRDPPDGREFVEAT